MPQTPGCFLIFCCYLQFLLLRQIRGFTSETKDIAVDL